MKMLSSPLEARRLLTDGSVTPSRKMNVSIPTADTVMSVSFVILSLMEQSRATKKSILRTRSQKRPSPLTHVTAAIERKMISLSH